MLGTNFATEQKEFYLFKGCQSNPCFVLRCFLSWRRVLGGGSPAESCRAGTVKQLPCRAWDKAQNYTDLGGKDSLSLSQPWPMLLQRQFSHNPCPGQAASAQLSLYRQDHRPSPVSGQAVPGILLTFSCSHLWCCSCVLTVRYVFSSCILPTVS